MPATSAPHRLLSEDACAAQCLPCSIALPRANDQRANVRSIWRNSLRVQPPLSQRLSSCTPHSSSSSVMADTKSQRRPPHAPSAPSRRRLDHRESCGVRTPRWCPAVKSREIDGSQYRQRARGIEVEDVNTRHGQCLGDVATLPCQTQVVLEAEKDVGWLAPVRDDDRAVLSGPFGAGDTLIQFAT